MHTSALILSAALGFAAALLLEDGFGFDFGFPTASAAIGYPASQMTCDELRWENKVLWDTINHPELRGNDYAKE